MPVIAITNMKGGTAKTSTCFHLGGILAKKGSRVLLIDGDPQGSLTQGFWGPLDTDKSRTIYSVFQGDALPERVIHSTEFSNLWLVPGHEECEHWNMIPKDEWVDHESAIREFVEEVRSEYDYVLIDGPPNLYLVTHSILMASDWALIPLQPEDFGSQGMVRVNKAITRAQSRFKTRPQVLGYVLSLYNPQLQVHQAFGEQLRETYGQKVFSTTVPLATNFKVAVVNRTPISYMKGKSQAHKSMEALAAEIEERVGGRAA